MKIKNLFISFLNFIKSIFKAKKMTSNQQYVWYAGYGSNLYRERFHCYIVGGTPPGADDEPNPGCTDKTLPVRESSHIISHDFYFAGKSRKWQGGGIGFIRIESDSAASAYCNMYLITKEQFLEVVQQENSNDKSIRIDFDAAINSGSLNFKPGVAYGNLLLVGNKEGFPIFTFTHEENRTPFKTPSSEYLNMITKGLIQTHNLNKEQLVNYLISRDGVRNNYTLAQLEAVYATAIS